VHPLIKGAHHYWCFILNIDHTLVYFLINATKTLEVVGRKTVHIQELMNNTKQATVTVTIAGNGTVLPLVEVFKGKPKGCIATKEFSTYPRGHSYCCQDTTWMDAEVMIIWLDKILKQYLAPALVNVKPHLILDNYQCHMRWHW
jgi:hypothetical protein